jgi:hypothetical protein
MFNPSEPVRVSKLNKSGTLLGYGDHKISTTKGATVVHFADGTNVSVGNVMAGRWAITQEVMVAAMIADES